MKKKLFVTLLITLSTLFCTFACANAEDNINVTLNDEIVTFDSTPVMENDRILVPIRAIAEKMEFDVNWDQDTQTVTLENFNTILTLKINENSIIKDLKYASESYGGKISTIELDAPAKILNERTYIPLRAVTESFGCDVDWNQESQTAEIIYLNTYGDEVMFEDEGIEYLVKYQLLLDGININSSSDLTNEFYSNLTNLSSFNEMFEEIYPFKIHEGSLKNIDTLGGFNFCEDYFIFSLEDIKKFPNLKNINFREQYVRDLTPLTYKKDWDKIYLGGNPISNFAPLLEINVSDLCIIGNSYFTYSRNELLSEEENKQQYKVFAENLNESLKPLTTSIKNQINYNMTRKEKVTVLNNWICEYLSYDFYEEHLEKSFNYYNNLPEDYYNYPLGSMHAESNSLTTAILDHYAICEGYSSLFQLLCDMSNIPCIEISGTADGIDPYYNKGWGGHAWNAVLLENGNLYYVDTTWNDTSNSNEYLLLTEEELKDKNNHIWETNFAIFNDNFVPDIRYLFF